MYHANINKMKAGEAILISDRANLTGKKNIRNEEKHYVITGRKV